MHAGNFLQGLYCEKLAKNSYTWYSIYVRFSIASEGMQCINQLLQKLLLVGYILKYNLGQFYVLA